MKKISNKNKLVKRYLEHKSPKQFLKLIKGKTGVYILYKNNKVYYVGKSQRSVRGRIRNHATNKHKGKWNNFSFYQIKKKYYIRDIETLLLHIFTPPGNRDRGRFRSKYDLSRKSR